MTKLTDKQKRFVDEYLIDLNAAQAAIRAGYSKKTAREIGSENLAKPYIALELKRRTEERRERLMEQGITDAAWVLEQAVSRYNASVESENEAQALRALELIGKHRDVQAWKERVEVTQVDHVAILERRIAQVERMRPQLRN